MILSSSRPALMPAGVTIRTPAALTSPKIKKLAAKAPKSPSMLTTMETRELGAAVLTYLSAPKDNASVTTKKVATKQTAAKKSGLPTTVSVVAN